MVLIVVPDDLVTEEPSRRVVIPYIGKNLSIHIGKEAEGKVTIPLEWSGEQAIIVQEIGSWTGNKRSLVVVHLRFVWRFKPMDEIKVFDRIVTVWRPWRIGGVRRCRPDGHGGDFTKQLPTNST